MEPQFTDPQLYTYDSSRMDLKKVAKKVVASIFVGEQLPSVAGK